MSKHSSNIGLPRCLNKTSADPVGECGQLINPAANHRGGARGSAGECVSTNIVLSRGHEGRFCGEQLGRQLNSL